MRRLVSAVSVLLFSFLLFGCETQELDNVNLAQECLNKIPDANYSNAASCRSYVSGNNTPEAKVILCQIDLVTGGITTTRMINAYSALDAAGAGGSKEAIFMAALAMTSQTIANQALSTCAAAGIESLTFIATMSSMGTALGTIGGFPLPTPGNEGTYTPPSEAQVDSAIANCNADPTGCATTVGNAVVSMGDAYCGGGNADQQVCSQINDALANSDGTPQGIGLYLLGLLNN